MTGRRVGPAVGVAGCVAVLAVLAAPYVLVTDAGTGLTVYYAAGSLGGAAVGVLAALAVVAFLSGTRGSADDQTAAGVALVVSVATLGAALLWAVAVDPEVVLNLPAAWMGTHRWAVVAVSVVPVAGAAAYARAVL